MTGGDTWDGSFCSQIRMRKLFFHLFRFEFRFLEYSSWWSRFWWKMVGNVYLFCFRWFLKTEVLLTKGRGGGANPSRMIRARQRQQFPQLAFSGERRRKCYIFIRSPGRASRKYYPMDIFSSCQKKWSTNKFIQYDREGESVAKIGLTMILAAELFLLLLLGLDISASRSFALARNSVGEQKAALREDLREEDVHGPGCPLPGDERRVCDLPWVHKQS